MPDTILTPFIGRLEPQPRRLPEPPEETIGPGRAYAVVAGLRPAVALEFIRKDGCSFTIPYGYAPLLWWNPPTQLIIEYPGVFSVLLRGKNLGDLQRRIRDCRVTWVREFAEADAEALPLAVTRIEITLAFPSREGDGFSTV